MGSARRGMTLQRDDLAERRDELRSEIRRLVGPLMALAVRPEINLPPSQFRNLLHAWDTCLPSAKERLEEASNFLADLQLKLRDPATAAALARADAGPNGKIGDANTGAHAPTTPAAETSPSQRQPLAGWTAVADAVGYYELTERQGDALRKRLSRYRRRNPQYTEHIMETASRATREPQFLYSGELVHKYATTILKKR